jgi:hypothetical protein
LLFQICAGIYGFGQEEISRPQTGKQSFPVTIHLSSKTLSRDKVLLQWTTSGKNGFYIIERSIDLKEFEMIGVMKVTALDHKFEFVDEKPFLKRNYYRVKMEVPDEADHYSDTVAASTTDSIFCKFYPNPVDKLLILRSEYPVDLKIYDITGRPRIIQQMKPGVQVLDLSGLEKNIYIISIFHEESNQFITRKLIKN